MKPKGLLEAFGTILRALWEPFGPFWEPLGPSGDPFGSLWEPLGSLLAGFGPLLGSPLEPSWANLGVPGPGLNLPTPLLDPKIVQKGIKIQVKNHNP